MELRVFERLLDVNSWIEATKVPMARKKRANRKREPTKREFLLTLGLWLRDQVLHSKHTPEDRLDELSEAQRRMKNAIVEDRRAAIAAGLRFSFDTTADLINSMRHALKNAVEFGQILAIDETILNTKSREALKHGRIKMIEGKPHPMGYFAQCSVQKLQYSKCILVTDIMMRRDNNSKDANSVAVDLIQRSEELWRRPSIVLLDAGYHITSFLSPREKGYTSKFICSVKTNSSFGEYRHVTEAAQEAITFQQKSLLYSPELDLTAFARGDDQGSSVLLTNAYRPDFAHPRETREPKYPLSVSRAEADSFSEWTEDSFSQVAKLALPDWSTDKHNQLSRSHAIFKLTGHDLAAPLDQYGFVTKDTLSRLKAPQLCRILKNINQKSLGLSKDELITKILAHHPHVQRTLQTEPAIVDGASDAPAAQKRQLEADLEKLFTAGYEPKFAEVYSSCYGLEDRFNQLIYDFLAHTLSKHYEMKFSWLALYMCLVNAYGVVQETHAEAEKDSANFLKDSFSHFCATLISQIAEVYGNEVDSDESDGDEALQPPPSKKSKA